MNLGYLLPGKLLAFVAKDLKVQHEESGEVTIFIYYGEQALVQGRYLLPPSNVALSAVSIEFKLGYPINVKKSALFSTYYLLNLDKNKNDCF